MFEIAAFVRLIEELSFIETASPPASSAGLVMRLPLDNLGQTGLQILVVRR